MIVIGADIHKRNHMLVAVGAQTGELRSELQIPADEQGHQAALRWARDLDAERVWALEDCRQVSRRLEQALLAAGERVVRVAPRLTGLSRRADRRAGKSDPIDALAVARVAVREGPERLPSAFLDERAMEIRLLADHREDLVAERTRAQNRLRWHLLDLCPELEAQLPVRSLSSGVHLRRLSRHLEGYSSTRGRVARELLARIGEISEEVKRLQAEIKDLVGAHRPALLEEAGCGAAHRRHPDRPRRRCAALPGRGAVRPHGGRRPDPGLVGEERSPSPPPRRRSPAEPRPARDRDHPIAPGSRDPRLPRQEAGRGQEQPRGPTLPQAPPGKALLPSAPGSPSLSIPINISSGSRLSTERLDIGAMHGS
jgi:transposase